MINRTGRTMILLITAWVTFIPVREIRGQVGQQLETSRNSSMVVWGDGRLTNPHALDKGHTARLAPVMEQVFWVQLPVPPQTKVKVKTPEGIKLLDATKPGKGRKWTRFYFRSDRGIANARIVFSLAGGGDVRVPVAVKTYREDIEEQITMVTGVAPSVRKQGRSYYIDEMIAIAKRNMKRHPSLLQDMKRPTRFDGMSDHDLWKAFPSWNVPRECYSSWPCPYCGSRIFKRNAFYAWGRSYRNQFKCKCPLCNKLFPSNDYLNDDFTSGACPDDGWGYDPGSGKRDDLHAWVAYYTHHVVWKDAGRSIERMALRCLLLKDREAGHRVGVLLARLAYVYPGLNCRWQQARPKYLGRRGRALIDGNWERNGLLIPALRAYDAVFDCIGTDTRLVRFLGTKDSTIKSPDDVKALLDTYLVQVVGWDWIRRELTGGNQGAREQDLAEFIVCANMGKMGDRWLEELFTHAYNSGMNRGGFDDETQINTLTREGPTLVASFDYASGYVSSKSDMAEILSRTTNPKWKARCNLYDPMLYPKFHAEFHTWLDMIAAGQFAPCYGDSPFGSNRGGRAARHTGGLIASLRGAYERAYRRFPSDRIARAIYKAGKKPPQLFEPDIWPKVKAHARKAGPEPPPESRVLDGVGFVFLESRPHEEDLKKRAAIAFRYGYGVGHHHDDNLNIEMWAHGDVVSPELGYPCWAHPMGNTSFVAHHNTGMIDGKAQYAGGTGKGALELFAAAPGTSFADASAEPSGFPNRVYRRAVCLTDAPHGNVYLLDVFRMAGGTTRTYCFHGPGHNAFDSSVKFGAEEKSPLRIVEVGRGLKVNIVRPQNAQSDSDAWADWSCDTSDMHIRLDVLGQTGRLYITAVCAKPDIPLIRYLFAEDEKPDGASEFISVWQPYTGAPFIKAIERLSVEGALSGEYRPVAVRIHLPEGREDTFVYTFNPEAELRIDSSIKFQGSFGYWSEQRGRIRCVHLVNGRTFAKEGRGIIKAEQCLRTVITAVDLQSNTVTLKHRLPPGDKLKGELIYFRNGPHRTAYHIQKVLHRGNVVKLDRNSIIFRSKIVRFGRDRSHLVTELTPRIPPCGGAIPHGYYDGACATGEDLRAQYRVKKTDGDTMYLDRPVEQKHFPDIDRDGRRMVLVYDIGPGDEVVVYNSVFVDRSTGKRVVKLGKAHITGIR